jgi:hypothetical protein
VATADLRGGQAMMQLARRASLVVVLLLLTSVGTASAESWVLWLQVRACQEGVGEYEYYRLTPRLTQRRCETDKPKDFEAGEWGPDCKHVSHVCLPDTVDPRGRKAK